MAIEAAELMEHFQWVSAEQSRKIVADPLRMEAVADELANVLCYGLALANELGLESLDGPATQDGQERAEISRRAVPRALRAGRFHNDRFGDRHAGKRVTRGRLAQRPVPARPSPDRTSRTARPTRGSDCRPAPARTAADKADSALAAGMAAGRPRVTTVPESLSCQACFRGSKAIQRNPSPSGTADTT